MKFQKVEYIDRDTKNTCVNLNKRVEYFLHYWNFLFQANTGLLFIHHEKLESHRSLIHKISLQIDENKSRYANRVESLLIDHPYFKDDNIIIQKSIKVKNEISIFKNKFNDIWFPKGKGDPERNKTLQATIKSEFEKIVKLVLRNYLNRLLNSLILKLVTDKPIDEIFKIDVRFLINAVIVELYHNGFSIDYIRKVPEIIVFPQANKHNFPYGKTLHNFGNRDEYVAYQEQILKTINLDKQIDCIKNYVDKEKYPKQKGYCVFKIDDFDFQLEEPITIWNVTFYNPHKTSFINSSTPEYTDIETDFNYPIKNNLVNSTCNAIISVEFRVFDLNNTNIAIHQAIGKVDKALQVLKKLKTGFVNNRSSVSGKVSTTRSILFDKENNFLQFININLDNYPFEIEQYQKSIFKEVLQEINRKYSKDKRKLDVYAYLCQSETDELAFNFKDYWTVLVEASFPNDLDGFINKCKQIFRTDLQDRLFIDTKIFLNNAICIKSLILKYPEYFLEDYLSKQIGLNIPEMNRFKAEKFKANYYKLKNLIDIEFLKDIDKDLFKCQNKPEQYMKEIDKWLDYTIRSAYAERNLESHNNITTDYSLVKLKNDFLYIGQICLRNKIWNS